MEEKKEDKKQVAKETAKKLAVPEFVLIGGDKAKVPVSARIDACVYDDFKSACMDYEIFLKERGEKAEISFPTSAIVEKAFKDATKTLQALIREGSKDGK